MVAARSGEGQGIWAGAAAELRELVLGLGKSARLAGCTLDRASLGSRATVGALLTQAWSDPTRLPQRLLRSHCLLHPQALCRLLFRPTRLRRRCLRTSGLRGAARSAARWGGWLVSAVLAGLGRAVCGAGTHAQAVQAWCSRCGGPVLSDGSGTNCQVASSLPLYLQGAAWSASNLGASDPRQFQYALHETDSFPKVGSWVLCCPHYPVC